MKVTLVGFKSVDFKDDNGDRVKGIKLFITRWDWHQTESSSVIMSLQGSA